MQNDSDDAHHPPGMEENEESIANIVPESKEIDGKEGGVDDMAAKKEEDEEPPDKITLLLRQYARTAIPCTNLKGPEKCYCKRGTTKPLLLVSKEVEACGTFCSAATAKDILNLDHSSIYVCLRNCEVVPRTDDCKIHEIPYGWCANSTKHNKDGTRKDGDVHYTYRTPSFSSTGSSSGSSGFGILSGKRNRSRPAASYSEEGNWKRKSNGSGGARRRTVSSSGASKKSRGTERPLNPFCTSGKKNCYCRSGRARAVYRVDEQGNVLEEYCSQSNAAEKLGLAGCSVNHVLNGHAPSARGHLFRYKQEGEMFMRRAKPVLMLDPDTGEVLREFESARAASNHTGVGNSTIGQVCAGTLESAGGYIFRFKDAKAAAVRQMELSMIGADPEEDREPTPEELAAARSIGVEIGVTEVINVVKGYPQIGYITSVRIPQHINRGINGVPKAKHDVTRRNIEEGKTASAEPTVAALEGDALTANSNSNGKISPIEGKLNELNDELQDTPSLGVKSEISKTSSTFDASRSEKATPSPENFIVGDIVSARFCGGDEFFPGTITAINDSHTLFSIQYDDGDAEENVRAEFIRSLISKPYKERKNSSVTDSKENKKVVASESSDDGNILEKAWFYVRFYDGCKATYQAHELLPKIIIPPPPVQPLPPPPRSGNAKWGFDELNRVVRCDVTGVSIVDPVDEAYLCELMDRPDITLIIRGLAEDLSPHLWSESYLRARCGNLMLHKLRCFRRVPLEPPVSEVVSERNSVNTHTESHGKRADTNVEAFASSSADSKLGAVSATKKNETDNDEESTITQECLETNWKSMKLDTYFDYLRERDAAYRQYGPPPASNTIKSSSTNEKIIDREEVLEVGATAAVDANISVNLENSNQPITQMGVSGVLENNNMSNISATETYGPIKKVLNHEGRELLIPVLHEGIYMIDFDLPKFLPELLNDLERKFKLDFLPRGQRCLLRFQPLKGHPFMGPNLYITPPGSFTHFHQDGHGTVDSGHQCLRGRNEVIMLRRLDEKNKRRALRILCGSAVGYDALYGKPHDAGEKPPWPKSHQIEELRQLGYCPSVFTLHPGEYVHINKGRLHAFRKRAPLLRKRRRKSLASSKDISQPPKKVHTPRKSDVGESFAVTGNETEATKLDDDDAYVEQEEFCVSVAWDWLYQGSSSKGVAAEVAEPVQCAAHNIREGVPSLGHIEGAVLQASLASLARQKAIAAREARKKSHARCQKGEASGDVILMGDTQVGEKTCALLGEPGTEGLLKGLKPALQKLLVEQSRLVDDVTFATAQGHYKPSSNDQGAVLDSGKHRQKIRLTNKRGGGSGSTTTSSGGSESVLKEEEENDNAKSDLSSDKDALNTSKSTSDESSATSSTTLVSTSSHRAGCTHISLHSDDTPVDVEVAIPGTNDCSTALSYEAATTASSIEMTPATTVVEDPFACDSYVCQGCQRELSNTYMQCVGCRLLLSPPRALNLCVSCHRAGVYKQSSVYDRNRTGTSHAHHVPRLALARAEAGAVGTPDETTTVRTSNQPSGFPAESSTCRAAVCARCNLCVASQCGCHLEFQMRHRFMSASALRKLGEDIVGRQ